MSQPKAMLLFVTVMGMVAAVGTMLLRHESSEASSHRESTAHESTATVVVERVVDSERIARLEAKIEELVDKDLPADPASTETGSEVPDEQSPEVVFTHYRERLEQQPVHRAWAMKGELSIHAALAPLQEKMAFKLEQIECRSSMCFAEVRWDDFESARRVGGSLASEPIPGLNCMQAVWLEPPGDVEAPYSARVYIDCEETTSED